VCVHVHVSNKSNANRFITENGKLVLYLRFSHLWMLNCTHKLRRVTAYLLDYTVSHPTTK